jgi:hypothetical protein
MSTALLGAGALASAFGGSKKQTTSENLSGYKALPKEVQDLLIQQYLPKAQSTLNMPYQNIPMQRATNPEGDPFASQGLWDLQKFSDAAGGYFSPFTPGAPAGQVNMPSYQGAAQQLLQSGRVTPSDIIKVVSNNAGGFAPMVGNSSFAPMISKGSSTPIVGKLKSLFKGVF